MPTPLGDDHQCFQPRALFGTGGSGQDLPKPARRAVADLGHQSCQDAHARQQHLTLGQPGGGQVEEQAGPLGTEPGTGVKPADQAEVLRLIGEVAVSVPPPDLARVLAVRGRTIQVPREAGRVRDPQLPAQVGDHAGWDIDRVGEEGAQESDRGQLQGEAQPVLVPAPLGDQGAVGVVEVEIPCQLGGRGLAGVAAVAPLLLRGQEVDGHRGSFRAGFGRKGRSVVEPEDIL